MDFQMSTNCNLLKSHASSDHYNCFLSSLAQTAGFVHPEHVNSPGVLTAVQGWRQRQHAVLAPKLQQTAPPAGAARWDANLSFAEAESINQNNLFMQGAHVSCAADELQRTILVLQPAGSSQAGKCGSGHLTANLYPPGYVAPRLDLKRVAVMAALCEQLPPFVVYLSGGHFSPLLTRSQREATVFPPRELMKLVRA